MLVNVLNLKGDDEDDMDLEDVEEPTAGYLTVTNIHVTQYY